MAATGKGAEPGLRLVNVNVHGVMAAGVPRSAQMAALRV